MYLRHIRYNTADGRVYYPQYDITGRVMGYIARYYPELADGKKLRGAKALWKPVLAKDMSLCFPMMEVLTQAVERKQLAVVEDYPSALRMNSQLHYPTLCLGGTNIYESYINTMLAMGINKLVIVLDADAITKAIKLKRSLGLAFDEVIVIPLLGADPKDMSTSELDKTFKQLRNY
jgi:DNA primase